MEGLVVRLVTRREGSAHHCVTLLREKEAQDPWAKSKLTPFISCTCIISVESKQMMKQTWEPLDDPSKANKAKPMIFQSRPHPSPHPN